MKIAVANFKAEITAPEVNSWLKEFKDMPQCQTALAKANVILCPPAVYLWQFKQSLAGLNVNLGCQNISQFENGAYTGEITAPMLVNLADYVLIGHSERRTFFQETPAIIQKKLSLANRWHLKTILCLEKSESYEGEIFAVAYEPHLAIGTGEAASPSHSYKTVQEISQDLTAQHWLYGGSVNEQNAIEFSKIGFAGVLVGKNSLSASSFLEIVLQL